jgi:hypothetical protein
MNRYALATALVAVAFSALPVMANAPETSVPPAARHANETTSQPTARIRPQMRPDIQDTTNEDIVGMALIVMPQLRPHLRPPSEQSQSVAARPDALGLLAPDVSAWPFPRPDSVVQEALFGRQKKRKGSVCGNLDIQGEKIGGVPGKLNGCGINDAVRVRSVSGVMLSRPATMDCTTAKALNQWVEKGVIPAFRRRGPVVELRVAAHYACRTRNNQPGAKLSEHGKGKAIDISAFTMNDGEVITVAAGWGKGATKRMLHKVWKSACGPFGTVLGPNANRFHRDHFHVDTAQYRSGPYCH